MSVQRQLLLWAVLAVAALALLIGLLLRERQQMRARGSIFLTGNPHTGRHLFEEKGCAHCHSVNGVGGRLAPDLGFVRPVQGSLNELVAAMWNHAPRMWQRIQAAKLPYPRFNEGEMADVFAYLYTARYVEEPGNAHRGQQLFDSKGCSHCHALYGVGGKIAHDLSTVPGWDTPIMWSQAMWNHAPAMEQKMRGLGLPWPKFEDGEMNDLLAYIREEVGGPHREFEVLPADPDRGQQLFETKSCIVCHALEGKGGDIGPQLIPRRGAPVSYVQFAALMWNHSPAMWRAMQARGISRPTFAGREMADLIAFLQSRRYFDAGGPSPAGEALFAERGCSYCHGPQAEGTPHGPPLRGRGQICTSTTLATALWAHGPKMYQRAQQLGRPWPTLSEKDIGELAAFLNEPRTETR